MQNNNEKTVEVLNDLIVINNDRVEGYERAISETKDLDVDLRSVFEGMINESKEYKSQLSDLVRSLGGEIEQGTTTSGKIYRAWMDIRAKFTGNDRKTILESCEFGEDAAQRAYESALNTEDVATEAHSLISEQQRTLKNSHDLIKKYRDSHRG